MSRKEKKIIRQLTNNKFLNIKEIEDSQYHVSGYQFAERRGVDSVAFIGYSPSDNKFLVNKELKPPIGRFITGAFGGSMDKSKSPSSIVVDEVREEAGFEIGEESIKYLGRVFVSTQMNQFCYLYLVILDRSKKKKRRPENAVEALAQIKWVNEEEIYKMEEWKPMAILALSKKNGIIKG